MTEPLDLKKTVNLPKTNFAQKANLGQAEPARLRKWADAKLYETIGLSSGATVFNIACLGQLGLNMLGIIPYLFSKSKMADIREDELSFEDSPDTTNSKVPG